MSNNNIGADDYGGSRLSRIIWKCNDFRSTPAAVLTVSTMAVFADTVVYGLIVPFLPDILQDKLGMSSSANGILFGCFGVGVLIGAPASGYISDRWKIRKWPMIVGLLGLGATTVLFALSNAFWELVVARLFQGLSSGITWAVGLGMVADVYAGEAIGKAMGVVFSGFTLGYLGGPVLGGAIYHAGGIHAIAMFVGAITVVDLISRLLLKEPKEVIEAASSLKSSRRRSSNNREKLLEEQTQSSSRQMKAVSAAAATSTVISTAAGVGGVCRSATATRASLSGRQGQDRIQEVEEDHAYAVDVASTKAETTATAISDSSGKGNRRTTMWDLLKEWPILACCFATITVTGAEGSFEPVLPIYMSEKYHMKSVLISVIFIALVIPNVIIGPIAGKFTDNERIVALAAPYGRFIFIILGSLGAAIAIAFLGATSNIPGLVVNLVVVGMLGGIAAVPIMSIMGVHVHRMGGDAYGKVYALFNIAYSVGVIVIPTILPPIMNAIGFAGTMGVVSAILVLGALAVSVRPTYRLWKYGRSAFMGESPRTFI